MYFIQRISDDMWLLSYNHGINSSGRPTCIWGTDRRDAMPFSSLSGARALAASITGCTVIFKVVRRVGR